jgi:hypothetical protein
LVHFVNRAVTSVGRRQQFAAHDRQPKRRGQDDLQRFPELVLLQSTGRLGRDRQGVAVSDSSEPAEPNLIAYNNREASFLAGGEFPVPIVNSLGQVTVQFKEFGVRLNFTPTIAGDIIRLKVTRSQHPRLRQRDHAAGLPHSGALDSEGVNQRRASRRSVVRDCGPP